MDFTKPPLNAVLDVLRTNGLRVLVIVIVAVIALRITTILVHGIVKALLDREATEGTAQELSAIEVQKRMDTLDELMSRVIRAFVVMIAGIMVLGALDLASRAYVIVNATHEDERTQPLLDVAGDSLPYFSTILVYTGSETW